MEENELIYQDLFEVIRNRTIASVAEGYLEKWKKYPANGSYNHWSPYVISYLTPLLISRLGKKTFEQKYSEDVE